MSSIDPDPPAAADGSNAQSDSTGGAPPAQSQKTPMYEAIHAPRYHRQELIKAIEDECGRRLICYVSGRRR